MSTDRNSGRFFSSEDKNYIYRFAAFSLQGSAEQDGYAVFGHWFAHIT